MNAAVLYPRDCSVDARVTAAAGTTSPFSSTPFSNGYVDVNKEVCDGSVSGICELTSVKRVPCCAKASMFGVEMARFPYALRRSARRVSMEITMTGVCAAAVLHKNRKQVS